MGEPKFPKKKYATPLHPWKEERIRSERELMKKYGLKNHREIWKAKTFLGKYRQQARKLLARAGTGNTQVERETNQLIIHLTRLGIIKPGATLDDVLALETEQVLGRRLQTLVYLKGLSSTPDQARQLINHGHIAINGNKLTIPGYMVKKEEENEIMYTFSSPLNEASHPARPKADALSKPTPTEAAPAKQAPKHKETQKEQKKPEKNPEQKPAEPKKEEPAAPAAKEQKEGGD